MNTQIDRVILYGVEPAVVGAGWWMTDAIIENNGDIRVCSGGGAREWHLVVAAGDAKTLAAALLRHLPDTPERNVLVLLARKFTASDSNDNPYDAIRAFMESENIRHTTTVW